MSNVDDKEIIIIPATDHPLYAEATAKAERKRLMNVRMKQESANHIYKSITALSNQKMRSGVNKSISFEYKNEQRFGTLLKTELMQKNKLDLGVYNDGMSTKDLLKQRYLNPHNRSLYRSIDLSTGE